MNEDFRSDRMETPEGKGNASATWKRAWTAYSRTVTKVTRPAIEPLAKKLGTRMAVDLLGFWMVWHLEGGFEGLQRLGMSRSAIYRRVGDFRRAFGVHPDEFELSGVDLDVAAYLAGGRARKT
ncbi:MAG: hypothetical protein Q7V58_06890 [Actinomycetota bacterium]|nr:hypothetical protein [Actinomycetota bacterium]